MHFQITRTTEGECKAQDDQVCGLQKCMAPRQLLTLSKGPTGLMSRGCRAVERKKIDIGHCILALSMQAKPGSHTPFLGLKGAVLPLLPRNNTYPFDALYLQKIVQIQLPSGTCQTNIRHL